MNTKPYQNFDVVTDHRGVVTVTLDVPDRPLNVLHSGVMQELDQIVHELENCNDASLVVFQSGKESGFLAGADVEQIEKIESAAHAMRLIEAGQTLFQRIEWLPMPTLALIHGPCLGGGLELSLACNYRVARDNSSTKIGLPEIKLGLIPGWGGTQRLPRRAGLSNALSLILSGKHLGASEAYRIGLVDRAIDPEKWDRAVEDFIDEAIHQRVGHSHTRRPLWQRLAESTKIGRQLIFGMTDKAIASKKTQYPALPAALRAVRKGFDHSPDGFLCERDEFVGLLATPTCRHLLGLFFAREKSRNLKTWYSGSAGLVHENPIRTVGVVGAGAMGAGIGQLAAVRGYDVLLKEVDSAAAEAGRYRVEKLVDDFAKRKEWSSSQRDELMARIQIGYDDAMLHDSDLVVEAVVEREDVKAKVFGWLDKAVQESAILTSNTSSLSVSKMAEATSRPTRVAGLHFFNPVHRMELVEVVRAEHSDDATIGRLVAFVKALGKTPVVTSDSPGFLVNRVLFPYLGEAVLMVGEGHDVAEMDKQIRRFGMPMGPLQLLDQVGLDVAFHVAKSLDGTLPGVQPVVDKLGGMVDQGHIGRKAGRGFYHYHKGKRKDAATLTFVDSKSAPADMADGFADDTLTSIQRRLVYPMLAEAVRCHEENVVRQPWAIDLAMVLGTGFAPHRGGPLHVIDTLGQETVVDNLNRLQEKLGERFTAPDELIGMSKHGESFFGRGDATQQHIASSS